MLRDYQIEICESVREAFKKHRSVMMQMPTGTGKTVVLASLVQQYLDKSLELRDQHCQVLIVAHRIELTEQMGEHLKRYGIEYGVIAGGRKTKEAEPVIVASIQTLSSKLSSLSALFSPSLIIIDEAHHAVAKTYRQLWDVWPEARFLGLTATPYRLSGEGFTDLFDVLVDSWTMKRFIAEGWLSAFDYYSIRPDSDDQKLIDNLKKRGADGDFQMKELHDTFDVTPCIERLFESFEQFAFDMKGIVYAIDIAHAEHIAEYYREQGVNALALSSKTDMKERKEAVEAFRASSVIVHHQLLKDKPIQVPVFAVVIVFIGLGSMYDAHAESNAAFFITLGIIPLLAGIIAIFFLKDSRDIQKISGKAAFSDFLYGFRFDVIKGNPMLYICLAAACIIGIAQQTFFSYLINFLCITLGLGDGFVVPMAVIIVASAVFTGIFGALSDRFGRRRFRMPLLIITVAGIVSFYLLQYMSGPAKTLAVYIGGTLMMGGILSLTGSFTSTFQNYIPSGYEGRYQGVRMCFMVLLPMIVGPVISLMIGLDAMGLNGDNFVPPYSVFLAAAIVACIAALPILIMNKKATKE